jgi:hypothetical protein
MTKPDSMWCPKTLMVNEWMEMEELEWQGCG